MTHLVLNILLGASALGILIFIYAVLYFYRSLKPPRFITPIRPSHYGLKAEELWLKTHDGLKLKAWYFTAPLSSKALIVCHGYPFDKANVLPIAQFLYPEYNLLLFDFRAMGESEGALTTLGYHETKDVEAAIEFLKERKIETIGMMGFSLGASVALMSLKNANIKAVIADSPFASLNRLLDEIFKNLFFVKIIFKHILNQLGKTFLKINISKISALEIVKNTDKPILLIHGNQDHQIRHTHSLLLKQTQPKIELWVVQGANHIQAYELYPEEYEERVRVFLRKHLN